ncbi:tenascin isoform X1 [Clarias gariepinus]|uniref:tenascin isoform X1 n=1 Tax=Clarias gariepinus TaxID=13013 RepID=UPI00234CB51A|nr:tenascin isoform X1 [Clarias gariepinus]
MGMRGLLLACVTMAIILDLSMAGLLRKVIRHRRESLTSPKPENMTLPNPDQPVVFNHVYNINVPTGSLCSVDLDSPGGAAMKPKPLPSEQHIEHTVDGENQIVFTHRINIPKQACGCDNHMPDLKDLLNRLEMLEAEVSSLREQCTSGAGCCGAQVTGELTTKPYCSGRGNYSTETCGCVCEPGWKGPNCSESECPGFCQDQGRCVNGKCICFEGFGGEDCGIELCPVDCGEYGQCIDGACVCAEGYMGEDCSMTDCLNNCLGRGRCVDGECLCNEPWTGFDCSELICPNDCFDRGRCINGTCYCDVGFTGEDCGELTCPDNCNNKGICVNGQCVCNFGFSGEDCSIHTCPKDCSKKGHCFNGRCICDPGFQGEDCSILSCPDNCNDRGTCLNGQCICDPGYEGDDCSELSCPNDCHNRGRCIEGKCICKQGFTGEDCSIKTCPNDCHDHGECVDGICVCHVGFTGRDCSELTCPNNCHNQGRCVNGQCVCSEGFTGEDCSEKTCPNNCHNRGLCVNGQCVCSEGFTGEDCSEKTCPNNCHNRGLCVNGQCVCNEGFTGEDCSEKTCPNNCHNRGRCVNGHCVCNEGFTGEDCGELTCLNNCHNQGRCVNGQCVCNEGFTGEDCSEKTCPNNCHDQGLCVNGLCVCNEGFTGEDCSEKTCPNNCHNRGRCVNGQCVCNEGFTGEDCGELTCLNNCHNQGRCVNGQCVCNEGFTGEDCSEKTCPNNCHDQGLCVNGLCVCSDGFTGEDCSEKTCPNNCHDQGLCVNGQCVCSDGFTGEDCSEKTCPNNCHNRGRCVNGQCVCKEGFTGEDCSELTCLNNCHNRGLCVNGQCVCSEGFTGEDCGEKTCPNNCLDRGYCDNGECMCYEGYTGVDCSEMTCPGNCNEKGRCLNGMCICELGFTGEDCSEISPPTDLVVTQVTPETVDLTWVNEVQVTEYLITYMPTAPGGLELDMRVPGEKRSATIKELEPGVEYLISVYAVLNNKMSIPVSARVATHLPQPEGLKFKTVRETSVEVQWDPLNVPFDGWNLIFRNTKEENGEISNPLSPPETTFEQSGLGPGQEYEVKLEVVKNNTHGPPANANVVTMIDAPSQVDVRDVSDTTALITWFQPIAHVDSISMSYVPTSGSSDSHTVELSSVDTQYHLAELYPDTEYSVSLMARRGEMTSIPVAETFTTDLDAPSNLRAIDQTEDSITLEWKNSQANVPSYRIKYGPLSGGEHGELTFPSGIQDITKAKISGLRPGTEYGMGVTAIKDEKESAPTTTNAVTDLDAPKDLEVSETSETTMVLIWRRPVAKIDVYKLVLVSADGHRAEFEVPDSVSTYMLRNLNPGMLYTITLTAERGRKKSMPASIQASTDNEKPLLGNITISAVSWDGFNISWELKRGDLEGFLIEVADPAGLSKGQNHTLSGLEHNLAITDLSPSTFYRVTLYGQYKGGLLEPVFGEALTEAEPELEHLFVTNNKPDGFTLQWTAPEEIFEMFMIQITDGSGKERQMSVSGDKRTEVISGLDEATEYKIKLFGTIAGRNFKPISGKALTGLGKLKGVRFSDVTDTSATVHWTVPHYRVDSYRVTYVPIHGGTPLTVTVDGSASHTVLPNLTPAMTYRVNVVSVKGLEESEPSSDTFTTGLGKPKGIRLSDITDTSANVHWTVPHYHVDSYRVTYAPVHEGTPITVTVGGGESQTVLHNLTPGVTYGVSVISVKGLEESEPASESFKTGLSKPKGIRFSDITDSSANVHWTVPRYHIDSYKVTYAPAHGGSSITVSVDGSESHTLLPNLTPAVTYDVSVISVKGLEESEPALDSFTTGLGTPKGIRFSDVTDTSATVHWTIPRYRVDSYRVTYVPIHGGRPMMITVDGGQSQTLLPNLTPGVTYQVSVISVKGREESEPASDTVTTALDKPHGLVAVNITDTTALLHWQPTIATVDGYVIIYSAESIPPITERVSGNIVEFEMSSLYPGTEYTAKVYAVKEAAKSAATTTQFTTDVDSPQDLEASNIQTESATLTWRAPQAQITGYILTYESADGIVREVILSPTSTSYNMNQLSASTEYTARLQAISGPLRSHIISTVFTTIGILYRHPKDCSQALLNGDTTSGLYTIYMRGDESQPLQVYCDMTTDGGGWIVFVRRQSGKVDFFRNWRNYTAGFGDMNDEFWLGLSNLHKITSLGQYELRVDLSDKGEHAYAQYDKFSVSEPRSRYKVHVGGYSGTAGDSMTYHNGRPFSTYDHDNDIAVTNCALSYKGAFWYKNCHRVNIMGRYGDNSHSKGVNWFHWKGHEHSIEFAEMKIRPSNFRNFEGRRKRS